MPYLRVALPRCRRMLFTAAIAALVAGAVAQDCDAEISEQMEKSEITKPYVVAHRGFSGILPEHTLAAYQAGIDAGADFIECDMVLTKDRHIVCRCVYVSAGVTAKNNATRYPSKGPYR